MTDVAIVANQKDDSASFADNDLSDDSLPSLDKLLRPPKNGDTPQLPPQIHEPLHGSKHQLFKEDCLPTDSTTSKGNTKGRLRSLPLSWRTLY